MYDEQRNEMVVRAWAGHDDEAISGLALPPDTSLVGLVYRTGQPHIVDDSADEPSFETAGRPALDAVRSVLGVPLLVEGQPIGVLFADNFSRPHAFDQSDLRLLRSLAGQAAVAVENARLFAAVQQELTERQRAEEALHRSLEETARGQRLLLALSQAAQAVQRARTPDEVYRTIGEEVVGLGYNATILTLTDGRAHLTLSYLTFAPAVIRAAEKLAGLSARGYHFPLVPDGFFHRIITEAETTFTEGKAEPLAEALPRLLRPLAERLVALMGAERSILAPLAIGDQTLGLLAVTGADLTAADVPAVSTFANQAAIALENARLFSSVSEQQQQLRALSARLAEAEEAERQRLTRELHDQVGQSLTALGINLNIVRSQVPAQAGAAHARLDDSLTLVAQTTERIRDVMADLRPPVLDDYGLLAALRWHGERFSPRTGVTTIVQGEELTPRLPSSVETALFRIAQEALTNAAKHAQASQVTLTLEAVDGGARLTIADDGVGFDPPARRQAGWGLLTMRERAEAVGGHLRVESAPGEGTRVIVDIAE